LDQLGNEIQLVTNYSKQSDLNPNLINFWMLDFSYLRIQF